jgi:hypothetical protein
MVGVGWCILAKSTIYANMAPTQTDVAKQALTAKSTTLPTRVFRASGVRLFQPQHLPKI